MRCVEQYTCTTVDSIGDFKYNISGGHIKGSKQHMVHLIWGWRAHFHDIRVRILVRMWKEQSQQLAPQSYLVKLFTLRSRGPIWSTWSSPVIRGRGTFAKNNNSVKNTCTIFRKREKKEMHIYFYIYFYLETWDLHYQWAMHLLLK